MRQEPLTESEILAAGHVGKAMLKAMKETKLPPRQQVNAAIHALIALAPMVTETTNDQ